MDSDGKIAGGNGGKRVNKNIQKKNKKIYKKEN